MKTIAAFATASILSLGICASAQAQTYPVPSSNLTVGPGYERTYLYTGRSVYVEPPGPFPFSPLVSPYHTLCGLTLATECAEEYYQGP